MSFTSDQLIQFISGYFWPFVRITTALMVMPVFGATSIVPKKIRLMLALSITALVAPLLPASEFINPVSAQGVLVLVQQILLGVGMGFLLKLAFEALLLGGLSTSMPMGLGFANIVDPQNGIQVPVLSTFFTILGTLLFLAMNGHLIALQVLIDSFTGLPVGPIGLSTNSLLKIALWGSHVFLGGILIALPAIMIITLINITFGVMTKAAPQLNIFAVGFPTTMAAGFLVVFLTLPNLLPRFMTLLEKTFDALRLILGVT
ncbi:MAG: flagellar biosynthetic protein FliR [Gammaproteobacteria bacterium]|nr:flagellar biosynthetic protein FliR [Gammaproteobacteria bacterium]